HRSSAFLISFHCVSAYVERNLRRDFPTAIDSNSRAKTSPPPFRRKPTPIFLVSARSCVIYPIDGAFLFLPPFRGDEISRSKGSSCFRFVPRSPKASSHSRW